MSASAYGQTSLLVDHVYSSNSSVSQILFPVNSPKTIRLYSSGNTLYLDDNSNGNIVLNVRGEIRQNGLYAGGNMTGPISSIDNAITRFDGNTGALVQNSAATIDDTGLLTSNYLKLNGVGGNILYWGNMAGAPSGSNNVSSISLGNEYYNGVAPASRDAMKIKLYQANTNDYYGLGMSVDQFNYSATGNSTSHVFYTNNVERARINSLGLTIPITSGQALKVGSTGAIYSAVPNPPYITLGREYGSGNPWEMPAIKLRIAEGVTPSDAYGFGVSAGFLNYVTPAGPHRFYTGSTLAASISSSGITTPAIASASGDLTIGANGSNVNFSAKNLTNITSIAVAPSSYGSGILVRVGNGASENINSNPTAISVGGGVSDTAGKNPKLIVYEDGTAALKFGLGVSSAQMDYIGPANHAFFTATSTTSTLRMKLTDANLQVSVPITSASGDLSIGSSTTDINFNSKNFNNVGYITQSGRSNTALYTGDSNAVYISNLNSGSNLSAMRLQTRNTGTLAAGLLFNSSYSGSTYAKDHPVARGFILEEDISTGNFNTASWDGTTRREHLTIRPADGEFVQFPNGILSANVRAAVAGGGTINFNGSTLNNVVQLSSGSSTITNTNTSTAGTYVFTPARLSLQTTDAVATIYASFTTPTDSAIAATFEVVCKRAGASEISRGFLQATFMNSLGTVTQVGPTITTWWNTSGASVNSDFSISGTEVRAYVQGVAGQTWAWSGTLTFSTVQMS